MATKHKRIDTMTAEEVQAALVELDWKWKAFEQSTRITGNNGMVAYQTSKSKHTALVAANFRRTADKYRARLAALGVNVSK